jgi:hypothetical protein
MHMVQSAESMVKLDNNAVFRPALYVVRTMYQRDVARPPGNKLSQFLKTFLKQTVNTTTAKEEFSLPENDVTLFHKLGLQCLDQDKI